MLRSFGLDKELLTMVAARLGIRLDSERRARLDEIAQARGVPVSELVREWIDKEYEAISWERRRLAVERIAQAQVEEMPDPDTLSRQLDETYAVPDLY
jgi:predicted DNA-binding protein